MKDTKFRILLDIHEVRSQATIPVKVGDVSCKIYITLVEGGKPYKIHENSFGVFTGKKGDNNPIFNNCIIENGIIRYDFTPQTVAAAGVLECEIRIYDEDGGVLTTPSFNIVVDERAVNDSELASTPEFAFLDEILVNEGQRIENERNRNEAFNNLGIDLEDDGEVISIVKTDIDGSQEKASFLKYADVIPPVTASASGSAITIDSANAPLQNLKLFGKTEQATTSGKNLIDCSIPTTSTTSVFCPVTVSEGNYILSMYNSNGTTTGIVANSTYSAILMDADKNVVVRDLQKGAFVSQENATKITQIKVNFDKSGYTGNSTTVYGQLESGLVATPYEQYTGGIPSPNPQFPQELKSFGDSGSYSVDVYGKNLIDVKDKPTDTLFVKAFPVFLKKGTILSHSILFSGGTSGGLKNGSGYNVCAVWGEYGRNEYEFINVGTTLQHDCHSIQIIFSNTAFSSLGGTATSYSIQVELGNEVTPYEPYKAKQTLTFTDTLRGIGDIADEKDFARGVTTERIRKIVFNGSEYWQETETQFYHIPNYRLDLTRNNYLSSHFQCGSGDMTVSENGIYIKKGLYGATIEEFKTNLSNNNIVIYTPYITPIETPLTEQELNAYRQLMTNKGNTTILNSEGADMEVDYYINKPNAQAIGNIHSQVNKDYFKLQQAIISTGGN